MKIVILDGSTLNPGDLSFEELKAFGDVTVYPLTHSEEDTIRRIGDSQIVLTNKVPITQAVLDACPQIRLICVLATGYNVIDCEACARQNIPVTNVPCYSTAAVAQFTFALMLEICHQIGHHDRLVHDGAWCKSPKFCFWDTPQMQLAGKTLGIIGYGRIGQAVGQLAKAFGMKVMVTSRTRREDEESVDLDTLLAGSDFVTLHCPQTAATTGLINQQTIRKMKDGAILINTARGGLLDETAVAQALQTGKLGYAAVDVVSKEPMDAASPLLTAPNCIITPHIAWSPRESRQRLLECVTENIRSFLAGSPQNVVNL